MMQAGPLRHRVILQTVSESRDATGAVVETWNDTATLWAAVEPLRGREWFEARATQADIDTRIRTRYYAGIVPKQRLKWGSRVFDIHAAINVGERDRELHLMCREVL